MKIRKRFCMFLLLLTSLPLTYTLAQKSAAQIPTPSAFLKFELGADRQLADYRQIRSYFKSLAASSTRVEFVTLGKTTLGEEMFMAVLSTEQILRSHSEIPRFRFESATVGGGSKLRYF